MWRVDYAGPGPHFEKGESSLRAPPERDVLFFFLFSSFLLVVL